jgi:hypothetical protein
MSRALGTPQTPHREGFSPPSIFSSTTSASQSSYTLSSSASGPFHPAKTATLKRLGQAPDPGESTPAEPRVPKRRKPLEARPRELPIPQTAALSPRNPTPYPRTLTPAPSPLRPHCLAKDRLLLWSPVPTQAVPPGRPNAEDAERQRIKDTMVHAWEEDTREAYGSGLLMWHCFCDSRATPEKDRAPASQALVSAFVAHMAAAYSGKTISNYLHGVRAWHVLHSVPWHLEKGEMDTMLRAADKLTPSASKKKKRQPYTPNFITSLKGQMNLEEPLDAAVFACLTSCFYASARLGEFTVRTLQSFNPNAHVTLQNLSHDQDRNGLKVTVLHLPKTKTGGNEGEDVYWALQDGETDPTHQGNYTCFNF